MFLRRLSVSVLLPLMAVSSTTLAQNPNAHGTHADNSAPASLLTQLKAARVTSNPEPPMIGGHQVCAAAGNAREQDMIALEARAVQMKGLGFSL